MEAELSLPPPPSAPPTPPWVDGYGVNSMEFNGVLWKLQGVLQMLSGLAQLKLPGKYRVCICLINVELNLTQPHPCGRKGCQGNLNQVSHVPDQFGGIVGRT